MMAAWSHDYQRPALLVPPTRTVLAELKQSGLPRQRGAASLNTLLMWSARLDVWQCRLKWQNSRLEVLRPDEVPPTWPNKASAAT